MLTAATFVLLYLVGCLMALARHPIYGLMTYVVVFYVSPSDRWWGRTALAGSRWALIAAVVTMVALVIHRTKPPQVPFLRQPLVIGMLVFVTWLGIQSFWALDPVSHQSLATYYAKFVVAMYLIPLRRLNGKRQAVSLGSRTGLHLSRVDRLHDAHRGAL